LLPPAGMYALHIVMIISALGVMLGAWYRWSAVAFFLSFTYTELIDLTYYLNHYYFVSLVSAMLIFVPAARRFSVDVWRRPDLRCTHVPRWTIFIFQFQLAIVYTYAGLAKINHTWLIEALPLRIWLPANDALPLIGPLLAWKWMPWVFSWVGMLYDCSIVAWLAWPRTRTLAYASVVVFHVLTGILFQIGVFPLVMMAATWIFFSEKFHERVLRTLIKTDLRGFARILRRRFLPINADLRISSSQAVLISPPPVQQGTTFAYRPKKFIPDSSSGQAFIIHHSSFIIVFFAFQLLFPWRYLAYPGNIFWTEQGYRFSWRVMLMEKAGTATFYVRDGATGREGVVNNGDFLCAHQEKQMAMQPDMILQFAHFLAKYYAEKGVSSPAVRAEVYVTLNAAPSRLLIDPNLDLTKIRDGWSHKTWINAY
jgi:hypothetical protein